MSVLYRGIPSVELGHHRPPPASSGEATSRLRRALESRGASGGERPAAAGEGGCELAALGKRIEEGVRPCIPAPKRGGGAHPHLSVTQRRRLARATLDRMRTMKPHHQAADACVYAFTTAFLHVFLVCVIAPSFFYWYYHGGVLVFATGGGYSLAAARQRECSSY